MKVSESVFAGGLVGLEAAAAGWRGGGREQLPERTCAAPTARGSMATSRPICRWGLQAYFDMRTRGQFPDGICIIPILT